MSPRHACTLYTQGREATKTNGTALTESRVKKDLMTAWIYPRAWGSTAPPQKTILLNSTWCRQRHSLPRYTFDVLLHTNLFITSLRCAEPGTITRFRVCSPGTSFRLLTLPRSMKASSRQASPDPSVLCASPRLSGIKARCNAVYY